MTAVSQRPRRRVPSPAATARWVLWSVAAVNVLIVEVLFLTADTPVKNTVIEAGKFVGLHLALVMIFRLVLVARLPWLDRRLGMDRLTSWHRWVGFTLFWTLVLHLGLIVVGYARLEGNPVLTQTVSLAGSVPVLLGMVAFLTLVVVAGVSVR